MSIIAPKPDPLELVETDSGGMSEAELVARHAEIQHDWRNGNAERHFVDVLDELHSKPGGGSGPTEAETDRIIRETNILLEAARNHLIDMLRPRGLTCVLAIRHIFEPEGYLFRVSDGKSHHWDIIIPYEDAIAASGQDERNGFTKLVHFVADKAIETRDQFFARVNALTTEIRSGS
jgi:hypothetical protein